MKTIYATTKKIQPTVPYNKNITDITRDGGKLTRHMSDNTNVTISDRDAIYDIVGMQYYYLTHKGKNPTAAAVAAGPSRIFGFLTEDGSESGVPILTSDEAFELLGHLTNGIYRFNNKKCMNADVAYGVGWMAYRLYSLYAYKGIEDINRLFYRFISEGTFVFQLNRKPLSRSLYKGLYASWEYTVRIHNNLFDEKKGRLTGYFDDLMKCKDVFDDPIHTRNGVDASCTSTFSIDNLVFTYCAAKLISDINKKIPSVSKEIADKLIPTYTHIEEFFNQMPELYRKRCEYFRIPDDKRRTVKDPKTYVTERAEIRCHVSDMILYFTKDLTEDYVPYLFYCLQLFMSDERTKESHYVWLAQKLTGRKYGSLDLDMPILGENYRRKWATQRRNKKIRKAIFIIALLAITAVLIYLVNF